MLRRLELNEHEFATFISGLKRLRTYLENQMRRDRRNEWSPQPGQKNITAKRLNDCVALLERYHNVEQGDGNENVHSANQNADDIRRTG